ncbi:MAG: phosphoglycerate dehydrogenase [Gemmatimonadaceae bacterium]
MKFKVLLTDGIDPEGVALLAADPQLEVDEVSTLPAAELIQRIGEYDALVGRSATRVTPELLRAAKKIRVIGRAGVGVDNIAMDTATELGIAIINAPAGNTVAVAELVFGSLLSLLRGLPMADRTMHAGEWRRSELLGGELKGRTLGIVGLGRIGSEVARRAAAFEMAVVAYDPYVPETRFQGLRVERADSLDSLLALSDVVTIHTPLTDETRGMVGKRELGKLKAGAIVVNLARGGIVEEDALAAALKSGRLAGAALDVFSREPLPADDPLRSAPNLFLTPHIGASTIEAQRNVARDVCAAVRETLLGGELSRSINIASVEGVRWDELKPALRLSERAAAVGRAILATQGNRAVQRVSVRAGSAHVGASEALLAAAAVGVLEGIVEGDRLNVINARTLAAQRGIELSSLESASGSADDEVEIRISAGMQEIAVAGTASPTAPVRLTRIGAFHVDVQPRGTLLILTNEDVPGVIGRVGTVLGEARINIAEYHQARLAQGGDALAAVSVDGAVGEEVRAQLLGIPGVRTATVVTFAR